MDKIAFFDIDETLVKGQTQRYLAQEAFKQGKINFIKLFGLLVFFAKYKLGLVSDVREIMEASYALLRGWKIQTAQTLIEGCFNNRIKKNIFSGSASLIADLKQQGYKIVLISNTLQPIVDLLADDLGADEGIGTELVEVNGVLQGRIGRLMYGQSKADYLINHYGQKFDFSDCSAYSDNKSDLPLLELVGKPVAVNPDAGLRAIAQQRNWPIISLA